MNGAESLIRSLAQSGVNVCFANPGTSEMHLVQAIDAVPEMRPVLALFEGVCTGAADGYGRMTGSPATTLLHLGPGFANGIANLHNARRAASPIINLIGNHPDYHIKYDAPLTSDIDTLAKNVSSWIKSDSTSNTLAADAMVALQSALTSKPGSEGQISTMIIPADACWGPAGDVAKFLAPEPRQLVDDSVINSVREKIDEHTMILLGGEGLKQEALIAANRVARVSGCKVFVTTFPHRVEGGAGRPSFNRLPYFPEHVMATLKGVKTLVLAGASSPSSFFAYPDTPGNLVPDECELLRLAGPEEDIVQSLEQLADSMNASGSDYAINDKLLPDEPTGKLTAGKAAEIIARLLPEESIICGDSGGGGAAFAPTQTAAHHTWLNLTGGSIGQGGPVSIGAAIACPDRPVLALLGDGAAMYTNQSFWTQQREGLNVKTVVFSNQIYGILETEYLRLGVNEVGDRAASLFDLGNPELGFTEIAAGMGVPGKKVDTAEGFASALEATLSDSGPFVIEAKV